MSLETNLLIEKSLEGDKNAFSTLFEMYSDGVRRILLSLCENNFDSNDLLQDTFIKAYLNLSKYNNKYSFEGWLATIAKNTFLDSLRKKANQGFVSLLNHNNLYDIIDENIENDAKAKEVGDAVAKHIESLPAKYREILELRYYVGYDYGEIAEQLNIPQGTVKTNLHRAKEELKKIILTIKDNDYYKRVD